MAKKRNKNFKLNSGAVNPPAPISYNKTPVRDGKVHVNLRYFQKNHQCFSQWQQDELKAFSNWLVKMSDRTPAQVTSTTQTCHAHIGVLKKLPSAISTDIRMYGLDVTKKGRVHGFFIAEDFFIVWLDRAHDLK